MDCRGQFLKRLERKAPAAGNGKIIKFGEDESKFNQPV